MESNRPITVLEAVGLYASSFKAGDNYEEVKGELFRFINWCGTHKVLSDIDPPTVGEYVSQIGGTGVAPQAVKRIQVIKNFLLFLKKQGLTDINLAQHVRVPRSKLRADKVRARDAGGRIELTQEGHAQLEKELGDLKERRAPLAMQIKSAAADKDVRENVPLEAAREQLGLLESRIQTIEATLRAAVILDSTSKKVVQAITLGAHITLRDLNSNQETAYTLVSPSEANPLEGKISNASPLGKALMKRLSGQQVEVNTPRGKMLYLILKVSS